MKKTLILTIVLLLAAFALAGCGNTKSGTQAGSDKQEALSTDSLKTFGDILALEKEESQWAVSDGQAVFAFKYGDTYYRAVGTISDEEQQKLFDIDYSDDDYEAQQEAILSPVAIDTMENLSEQILSQEELDKLIGMTGQEMQDAGWTFSGHDLEKMEFWMQKGPFVYSVFFDGEVSEDDYDSFEDETGTKDMTVKKAEFNSLGDATNLESE
jgi:predicted small secreted protein